MAYVGIDFETYGSRPLPTVGLDNYVSDPLFRPLIVGIATRGANGIVTGTYDFVSPGADIARKAFENLNNFKQDLFVAHNAGFERAVLQQMGLALPNKFMIDSAVLARINGGDSSLENCSQQLLGAEKMAEGKALIQKFCIPRADGTALVDDPDWNPATDPDWDLFKEYCENDARLSLLFVELYAGTQGCHNEGLFEPITAAMNQRGWHVDLVSVQLMQERAERNKVEALEAFQITHDPDEYDLHKVSGNLVLRPKLNLNSLKQLKDWCRARGVVAKSFDESHVQEMIIRIDEKLTNDNTLTRGVRDNYEAVEAMLVTKQIIGGSSLSKLPVILALTGEDDRLRDQYMHCGAGQTYRTSGRGVQMQNLKRMGREPKDLATLSDFSVPWSNDDIAENIRQVFTATNPKGQLIVGDFAGVESRGLAYEAGAEWKLAAFRNHEDLYKVLAAQIYGVNYGNVTKVQRTTGKVGELSCGYGAGGSAVVSFAKGMKVDMSEAEAQQLVTDWRGTNKEVVHLWEQLDGLLHNALTSKTAIDIPLGNDITVSMCQTDTPSTLRNQHPGAVSLRLTLIHKGQTIFERVFQGCYLRGRNVCYYKPGSRKTGALWSGSYINPKTKERKFYDLYGGKLAGILTQSFCRELFFDVLLRLSRRIDKTPGLKIVGQFHDEIVLDWDPDLCTLSLEFALALVKSEMTNPGRYTGFPLDAEVQCSYRYTK